MSAEGTKHGADCLVRDAQRVSSLSATETFDGVDGGYLNSPGSLARSLARSHTHSLACHQGVISTLLPFHVYARPSQLDEDYRFATSLASASGESQQKAMRRVLAGRTEVFEAQTLRKADVVRKKLGRLQRRIEGLEGRGRGQEAGCCEFMLGVCDGSARDFAAREEKRRREEAARLEEAKRLKEAARARDELASKAANAANAGVMNAPNVPNVPNATTDGVIKPPTSIPLKQTASLKLKLSMKKEKPPVPPQQLRAGSGANFLTSPAGQSLSLASHNPQMSGDASRMSPGLTDGATLVDSRAMSAEITTGVKRDEYDDVVSKEVKKEVKKEDAGVGGAAGAAPAAAAAPVQAQPAKAPVSGKFKLMKMMNKKK